MRIRLTLLAVVCVLGIAMPAGAQDPAVNEPGYEQQVHGFFKTYCVGCHNQDDSKGGLSLETHAALLAGGDSGETLLVAGKSGDSRLIQLLDGTEKPKMPPKDAKQPTAAEIALVRKWIDLGAKPPKETLPKTTLPDLPHIAPQVAVPAAITGVAFNVEGTQLAAGREREVLAFDPASGKRLQTLTGAEHPLNCVAVSRNGLIAAGGGPAGLAGQVHVWDAAGNARPVLTGHSDSIYGLAFSPDGTLLATSSYDKLIKLWEVETGRELRTLKHHTMAVYQVAFSPDGRTLASVGADQTVKLWDVATGQRLVTLTEATKGLNAVVFHPNGREVLAAGIDKMLRVWDWDGKSARLKRTTFAHNGPLLALAVSPDGNRLFTCSEDLRIKAWETATLGDRPGYPPVADWPQAMAASPRGDALVVGLQNGDLLLFDPATPQLLRKLLPEAAQKAAGLDPAAVQVAATDVRAALAALAPNVAAQTAAPAAANEANPPSPQLASISPRTAVRGTSVTLTLAGRNIWDADQVFVQPPDVEVTLLPGDAKTPNSRTVQAVLPAEMQARVVQLRLHTPLGSTEARSFYAGPFAELAEQEPNDLPDKAGAATLPQTWAGTISQRGDRDLWKFDATAGQELVFALVGSGFGSMLNAKLALLDGTGRTLALSERNPAERDVVIGHRFVEAGSYFLHVEDRNNAGSGNHFYYVHAGAFPLATRVFPPALQAGTNATLAVEGYNLAGIIPVSALTLPAGSRVEPVTTPLGKSLNSIKYEVSAAPELVETEPNDDWQQASPVPVPGAVSGHIAPVGDKTGDLDHFAFDAVAGQRLTIEVVARRLGSRLDSILEILDAQGQPVGRQTLRAVAETYTVLRDHNSRSRGIRLQNWDDFAINDLLMLGAEVVKIQELPLGPDEDVKFFHKDNVRLGFLGTTPQAHALDSRAFKIEVHPPGATFPPNGMPVVPLHYGNDDGGPGLGSDSQVLFDVPRNGRYVVRLRDVRNLADPDFVYRLVIRPRQEDFRLTLTPPNPDVPRGGSLPVTINLERSEGFSGPVDIRLEGLPAGITATTGRIGPEGFNCVVTLTSDAAAPPSAGADALGLRVIGKAQINAQDVERTTTPMFGSHQVTVTSPPDLVVQVEPAVAQISPGQELRFKVTVERRHGITARIPVDVLNLPHGLRVLDVGLNGVLITEMDTSRTFVVRCDPWAEPGPLNFYAAGKVEAKNERHAAPPIRLEVVAKP